VAAPSVFFSASVYRAIGSLREDYRLSMDFDMWVRMMNTGARVEHIPEYLGGFRWHDESKSTVSVKKMRGHRWNSERAEIMKRHMSGISYRKCQFWRTVYKWLQVANLNYARGWLECRPHKGRVWSEVFK
jgi:GT2 family glycosyltransferase